MRKACVIGHPVLHSLSPRLHGYWLSHYGIAGEYVAVDVAPEALGAFLKNLSSNYAGCNITLPHKEAALSFMDEIDETAKAIGAVNTVVVHSGKLIGSNSDAYGFRESLKAQAGDFQKNKAVVLGAGGAARAVVYALLEEGFERIVIANRTPQKALSLCKHFGKKLSACGWEGRESALEGADMLINATHLGLAGREPLLLDLAALPGHSVVCDIVYRPLETPLLKAAHTRGLRAVDGLGTLLYQAIPGFKAWFGQTPEVTPELRAAMMKAL